MGTEAGHPSDPVEEEAWGKGASNRKHMQWILPPEFQNGGLDSLKA